MEINETTNYDIFDNITGNRPLNMAKINKISTDVLNGFNMLPYCPIITHENDQKLFIIDGQHRYEVSKRTNNPVYYVICKDLTLKQIAIMNSRSEKWKPVDYLNCYINIGIEDYNYIKKFMAEHHTVIKLTIDLLMFNSILANTTEIFQSGEFKCNYYQEAKELIELTDDIFGAYVFSKDRYLIGAVQTMSKKGVVDWKRLKQKINDKPMMMNRNTDVRNYILNIERIYNSNVQYRVLLS